MKKHIKNMGIFHKYKGSTSNNLSLAHVPSSSNLEKDLKFLFRKSNSNKRGLNLKKDEKYIGMSMDITLHGPIRMEDGYAG